MYKEVMAHTHLGGWVIGQPPGCVFGSLSKQYGASPAALCKHSGLDPTKSKNYFSESSVRGCWLSSYCMLAGSIKEGRDTSTIKKKETSVPGTLSRRLKVSHTKCFSLGLCL